MKHSVFKLHHHFTLLVLLVLLTTFLAFSNIFANQFIGDDFDFITRWSATRSWSNLPQLLSGDLPEVHLGTYRPIRSLMYLTAYQIWGTTPQAYHAFSLITHLLATLLVIAITAKLTNHKLAAIATGLLFGLHPIHTEAVTFVSASFDTTSAVFFLASFYYYLSANSSPNQQKHFIISFIFATLAFFTNEQTIILPAIFLAHHTIFHHSKTKHIANRILPFFGLAGLYLFIRFGLLNITSRGANQFPSLTSAILVSLKAFLKYLELLIAPLHLNISHTLWGNISTYTYPTLNRQALLDQSFFSPSTLLSITIIISAIYFIYRYYKQFPLACFALAWVFISFLPVMNFFPASLIFTERYAYIPSFGFILLLTSFSLHLLTAKLLPPHHLRLLLPTLLIIISTSYFYLTYQRNFDWHDEITFWQTAAVADPANPTVFYQLAKVYQVRLQLPQAIAAYQQTISLAPNFPPAYHNLGLITEYQDKLNQAVGFYQQALELDPENSAFRRNLASAFTKQADNYAQQNQLQQAAALYAQASSVDPSFPEPRLKHQDLCLQFPNYCK